MRKLVISSLVMVFTMSFTMAQLSIKPYGFSPRQAEEDSTDIFNVAFNALLNVGTETQMYLAGHFEGANLTSPTWSVTYSGSNTSTADIGDSWDMDTTTQIVTFSPDVVGQYTVTLSANDTSVSVVVNAGHYIGATEAGTCISCHNDKYNEWTGTGHATMLERGLNGVLSSHYGGSCIKCHTTGNYDYASNDGFDDRTQDVAYYGGTTPFVFPDSTAIYDLYGGPLAGTLFDGLYDQVVTTFPNSMKLANIQCEACHGPGGNHYGNTADHRIDKSLDEETCAWCHDEGTHHGFPEQWRASVHGNPTTLGYAGGRAACARCHSGSGFIAFVENGMEELTEAPEPAPIACATCHDPHSAENIHQLRVVGPTVLENGAVITAGGNGQLCMTCHHARRNAEEYTGPNFSYSSHFGPHHGPQADMLAGTNVASFGKQLPSSPHLYATEDACVTCHMSGDLADADGNINHVGGHSFNMVNPDNGMDHVEACAPCHGDVGTTFAEKKYYDEHGVADHDGDGVEEGIQDEIAGMLEELALMLPPIDDPDVDMSGTYVYTLTEVKAAYNYFFVEEDRSEGIHNPAFATALLKITMQALENNAINGDIVAIDDVPNDQGYMANIVWDKLVDDGVSADPVASYSVLRLDTYTGDSTWTTVGEVTATGAPRYALDVPTLYNVVGTDTTGAMSTFKVVALTQSGMTHETLAGSGYSVDNLVPGVPGGVIAGVDDNVNSVTINWNETGDPDVNYYIVQRSLTSDFTNAVSHTTTDLSIVDEGLNDNTTYYYRVSAVDFSENQGEWSASVEATLLGTGSEIVPNTYSLSQNYPNPFNPVTTIAFSLKEEGPVNLEIYNAAGQLVKTVINKTMSPGQHTVSVSATDMASGMYIYTIQSGSYRATRKMVVLK